MKNWGWVIVLVVLVLGIIWGKFGFRLSSPALVCLYSDAAKKIETICVDKIMTHTLVKSPLEISGRARGNWFFEASFPIELLDQTGAVLAQTPGQAQGNWMTTDLVPFTAKLTFAPPTSDAGSLVFKKDNPSGLPQNDAALTIPIRFR